MYPYLDDRDPSIYDVDYVAFDLETTGLSMEAEICEIGAVKFNLGHDEEVHYQTLVRPKAKIPWDATAVHGITDEMVRRAPRLEAVLWNFEEFAMGSVLVAHNAKYDLKYIKGEEALKVPNLIVDTLPLARKWFEGKPSYSLGNLVENENWHRALPDSVACMKLFKNCVAEIERRFPDRAILLTEVTRA